MPHPWRVAQTLLILILSLLLVPGSALAQSEPIYPGSSWTLTTTERAGWSAEKLKAADDVARSIGTSAYMVVHKGFVVHAFGDVDRPMNLASARKSVLSVLYGIAVNRHQIDNDATLGDLGITDRGGLSDTEKKATVRELLEARSGIYHAAAYETPGMKTDRPDRGNHAPGTFWYYNNWDFNALGTIFQQLTGQTVFQALEQDLARPLQFEDFRPDKDTESVFERSSEHPAYVMRLSARDLARVGLLMARRGRWNERQIVSAKWVDESTTSYSDTSPGVGYGYLWWVGQNGWHFQQRFPGTVFSARGNFGQFVLVDPIRDLVVVHQVDIDKFLAHPVSTLEFDKLLASILIIAPASF